MSTMFHSGYEKARKDPRQPVRLRDDTNGALPHLAAAWPAILGGWNDCAGWELFVLVGTGQPTDVTVTHVPDMEQSARAGRDYIWMRDWHPRLVQHEMGHTLGYADHVRGDTHGYRGVMHYDHLYDDNLAFGKDDRAMLVRDGYGVPLPPPVLPPPPLPPPVVPPPVFPPFGQGGFLARLAYWFRNRRVA